MEDKMQDNELISALADGQLQGEAFVRGLEAACAGRAALDTWHAYHLIGDVLRSGELARGAAGPEFLQKLSVRLAQEQGAARPQQVPAAVTVRQSSQPAANDGVFRWKLVAGVASVAAFAAVGWSVLGTATSPTNVAQPQLAAAPQQPAVSAPATVVARTEPGLMIRDPKLDELLAAHRQFGGASALQMPAGFLRSATFEGPAR